MIAMDAPLRGALMFVRLVAACFMVVGLLDTGLYLKQCFEPKHPAPVKILPIVLNSIPFVIGVVILVQAKAIANRISDKLE
jgi:hypothetical protein